MHIVVYTFACGCNGVTSSEAAQDRNASHTGGRVDPPARPHGAGHAICGCPLPLPSPAGTCRNV
eukprot:16440621-Heterocapsa_arctica.AAC.1